MFRWNSSQAPIPTPSFPQVVFILDRDGRVRFHRSLSERARDDYLAGTSIYDAVIPQQRDSLRQALAFVFERRAACEFELGGLGPGNPSSSFHCHLAPNVQDGRVESSVLVATDVSMYLRRQSDLEHERDELLRQLEQKVTGPRTLADRSASVSQGPSIELGGLPSLSDRAGEAVFLTDAASGQLLEVNETACRWLGLSRDELLARSVRDLRGEPPLQVTEVTDAPLTETREAGRPRVIEGVCRRRNGSTFAVESSVAPVTVDGRKCILAIVRDAKRRAHAVQQLRDFQDRYQNLFEEVRDAVFITTRAGEIVDANGSALKLFRCSRDEIVGLDLRRRLLFRPDAIHRFQQETAGKGRVADLPVQLREGETASPAYLTATPMFSPDGAVRGYQCIVRVPVPQSEDRPQGQHDAAATTGAPPERGLVLLVSEAMAFREEAEQALERAGVPTIVVGDAPAAAQEFQLRRGQIGALVLDLAGRGRAGHDLFRTVLGMSAGIPLVAIGDEFELSTAQRLTLSQRVEFLPGPAHPLALVQRVQDVLKKPV